MLESSLNEMSNIKERCHNYEELKEKQKNYDCLILELEVKENQIKKNFNEKKQYEINIDKLYKELLSEREKYKDLEYEKKKLEYDIQILNNNINKLEDLTLKKTNSSPKKYDNNNNEQLCSLNLIVEENGEDSALDKLELLRICHDQSEKLNKLIFENDEIFKNYQNEKENLVNILKERDDLFEENTNLLNECKVLRDLLKSKADNQLLLEEKVINEGEKLRLLLNEKLLLTKEIETLKKQIGNQINFINKIEKEKKEINEINKTLQLELETIRLNDNINKNNFFTNSDNLDTLGLDNLRLKHSTFNNYDYPKEISKLRQDLISIKKENYEIQKGKDEEIQSLKNELISLNVR